MLRLAVMIKMRPVNSACRCCGLYCSNCTLVFPLFPYCRKIRSGKRSNSCYPSYLLFPLSGVTTSPPRAPHEASSALLGRESRCLPIKQLRINEGKFVVELRPHRTSAEFRDYYYYCKCVNGWTINRASTAMYVNS